MPLTRRHFLAHAAAVCTSTAASPLWAATRANPTAPGAAELDDDLELLHEVLQRLHPGLHRYLSPAEFEARFAQTRQAWRASLQASDSMQALRHQALALTQLTAALRCSHTYLNFYNQRGAVRQALCLRPSRLPLHWGFFGGRMVVTGVHASLAGRVAPGDELLAVNGRSSAELQRLLLPLVRGDGNNPATRLALLAPTGDDEFETFDILHPLLFGVQQRWPVLLRRADGRTVRLELPGITHAERLAMRAAPMPEPSDATPPWPLQLQGDGSAVWRMPGWAIYRTRWDWRAYIESCFQRLQAAGTQRLVIDLRGNEGGLDCGDEILARLITEPLATDTHERRTRYRQVPASLNPYLETWDNGFRDWGDRVQAMAGGFYRMAASETPPIEPVARRPGGGTRFAGKVAVLVDGNNHSATFRFAGLMRRAGAGLLLGSPTGGNQRGGNGGAFFFLRLPGTGIEVDVPLIGSFARGSMPDAGLAPDVAAEPTPADIAAGRDTALAAALRAWV